MEYAVANEGSNKHPLAVETAVLEGGCVDSGTEP